MWKCCLSVKQLGFGLVAELLGVSPRSKLFIYGHLVVISRLRVNVLTKNVTVVCILFHVHVYFLYIVYDCIVYKKNPIYYNIYANLYNYQRRILFSFMYFIEFVDVLSVIIRDRQIFEISRQSLTLIIAYLCASLFPGFCDYSVSAIKTLRIFP